MLFVTLAAGCTQTFFQPQRVLIDTPESAGLRYEITELRAADGVELFSWFLPARGTPRATVLFLHGNAENISTHFANVAWMPAEGFNVLALDYRGYGKSAGTPSLAGVQLDIDAALRTLLERREVDRGASCSSARASAARSRSTTPRTAPQRDALRAVIADSAFADYRLIVREKLAGFFLTWPFQWLPALTVDNDYSPLASVARGEPAAAAADPRRARHDRAAASFASASTKRRRSRRSCGACRRRAISSRCATRRCGGGWATYMRRMWWSRSGNAA